MSSFPGMRIFIVGLLGALATAPLAGAQPIPLDNPQPAPAAGEQVRLDTSVPGGARRQVTLAKGKQASIQLPAEADAHVTNPAVVDIAPRTQKDFTLIGVAPGQTDVVFYGRDGRPQLTLDVRVENDLTNLQAELDKVLPGGDVQARAVNDRIILTGNVPNQSIAGQVVALAQAFTSDSKFVLNHLTLTGHDQVTVSIDVVELQTNRIKQAGLDLNTLLDQGGKGSLSILSNAGFGINSGLQGGITATANYSDGSGVGTSSAVLKAFERHGLMRTVSSASGTAVSGEAGRVQSGGSFPVPSGLDNNGRVSIEFKEYGISLGFTPVVLSEGRIQVKLETEVSALDSQGAFTLTGAPGGPNLVVPGLTARKASTTIDLPDGGSQMIASLLYQSTKQNIDSVPGAGDLPIVGGLFRSRDYNSVENELVIIVTATLANPVHRNQLQTPADGLMIASDMETLLLGRLNSVYRVAPRTDGLTYQGPFGHVID